MKWALAATVAALAATVTINVLVLGYGATGHDPVGRLSPVASLPLPAVGVGHVVEHDRYADD